MANVVEEGFYYSAKSADYVLKQKRELNPGIKFTKEKDTRGGRDVWIIYRYPFGWKSSIGRARSV